MLVYQRVTITITHISNSCVYLVGGFKHDFKKFPSYMGYYGIILPIDEVIFFKMVETTNQVYIVYVYICVYVCVCAYNRWHSICKIM